MSKIKYLIIVCIFFQQIDCFSQNYLWLTNGKKVKITELKIESPDFISYKNLKGKYKGVESFEVFAIVDSLGNEKIIYNPDSSYLKPFSIPEMRSFVQGQYDASLKFKSPWTTVGGIAVAGLSGALINPYYVILIPTAYCGGIGLSKSSKKKLDIPAEFAQNEHYLLGYKQEVKYRRIRNSIVGSGIGILVGLTVRAIVNQ